MSGGLFGVGSGEIILILLIILLVMGPDRLPQVVRIWGRAMRFVTKFSNTWNQMNTQLMRQIDEEAKPLQNALRLDEAAPASPVDAASPSYPDAVTNTIAPPEFAGQPAPIPPPTSPDAGAAPAGTSEAAETSDA